MITHSSMTVSAVGRETADEVKLDAEKIFLKMWYECSQQLYYHLRMLMDQQRKLDLSGDIIVERFGVKKLPCPECGNTERT